MAFACAVLALLAGGCQRIEHVLSRPFEFDEPLTIGNETRLGSGPAPVLVSAGRVRPEDRVPRRLRLPDLLVDAAEVILHAAETPIGEKGGPAGPPRRRAVRAEIVRGGEQPLIHAPELLSEERSQDVRLVLHAVPFPEAVEARRSVLVEVKRGSRLVVHYGLRDDVVTGDEGTARFVVEVRDREGAIHRLLERELDRGRDEDRGWQRSVLDVAPFAGQQVEVRLDARGDPDHLVLPAWGGAVLAAGRPERPNLILISLDTLRARSLGVYGYQRDTSPFLDRLARESTVFEHAMTTAATTGPAHMSMFTGLYPPRHGVMGGMEDRDPEYSTIAQRLRAGGYHTAAFTENGFLIRHTGAGDGFTRYTENRGKELMTPPGDAQVTFSQVRDWLQNDPPRPFFLFVHTYQVHSPYEPPAPYDALFEGDGAAGPEDDRARRDRDNYDREIRLLDDELERFFGDLRSLGLARDTVVVITSDHGEEFGEHGFLQHSSALFDEVMHIPLLVWGPGRIPAGRRVAGVASLIDIHPTLLEIAGLPPAADVDGLSLLPATQSGALPDRAVYAEARGTGRRPVSGSPIPWNPPLIAWRTRDAKYIAHRPETGPARPALYYDLLNDPGETTPMVLAESEQQHLEATISSYVDKNPDQHALARDPDQVGAQLDPEIREKLRQLGYVE